MMNNENNKQYMKRLLIIAVPIMLSNTIAQLQMTVDRIFLGHANDYYMSALGNATSPMWTTMSFCFSIATGASILISQSVGAGKHSDTEEYAGAMIKYNNIIPIILFLFWLFCSEQVFKFMGVSDNVMPLCLGYVRCYAPVFLLVGLGSSLSVILQTSNYTSPLVIYGLIRSGINVLFDWILIFGKFGFPKMGIKGAAIGTTLAEYIGGLFLLFVFLKSKKLTTRPSFVAVRKSKFKTYIVSAKLGVNTALEDFAWNFGNLMLIRILNTINDVAAGIYSIIFGIEVLFVVIIGAVGNGTMTLTSEATGKKDVSQYKGVCLCGYFLTAIVSLSMLLCAIIIPDELLGLFSKDSNLIATSGIFLLLSGINLFSKSANIIIGSGIRGYGNTSWMFYTQIFGTFWVVGMAALFVFVLKIGIVGVFLAVLVDEFVRAIINLIKYLKIVSKWEKKESLTE